MKHFFKLLSLFSFLTLFSGCYTYQMSSWNDDDGIYVSSIRNYDYGQYFSDLANEIIEIQAFPESNDVIGLKDLYLEFSISDSAINMVRDTITSGEQISGVGFKVTSSYTNGELTRG